MHHINDMRLPMKWKWKGHLPIPVLGWKSHNNKPKRKRNVRPTVGS